MWSASMYSRHLKTVFSGGFVTPSLSPRHRMRLQPFNRYIKIMLCPWRTKITGSLKCHSSQLHLFGFILLTHCSIQTLKTKRGSPLNTELKTLSLPTYDKARCITKFLHMEGRRVLHTPHTRFISSFSWFLKGREGKKSMCSWERWQLSEPFVLPFMTIWDLTILL